jgi:hypothetical protein
MDEIQLPKQKTKLGPGSPDGSQDDTPRKTRNEQPHGDSSEASTHGFILAQR